eukprot:5850578-Prymnesium_polylepis.1
MMCGARAADHARREAGRGPAEGVGGGGARAGAQDRDPTLKDARRHLLPTGRAPAPSAPCPRKKGSPTGCAGVGFAARGVD